MDPSNQATGILKWAAGIAAGWMISRFKLSPDDAAAIIGALTAVATLALQILHRWKVARAQAALAKSTSTTDAALVSSIAKAA